LRLQIIGRGIWIGWGWWRKQWGEGAVIFYRVTADQVTWAQMFMEGPANHVSLQNLAHLNLISLNKLIFIFTLSLAQSLPKLESLNIGSCGELKHLIREKDDAREITTESLCFPKLRSLSISYCGKLEYVFPVSVSPSLLNLEEMEVDFADNVKQIFYTGEGDALTRDGIIKFPKLYLCANKVICLFTHVM